MNKYQVLSGYCADNANANSNNITFTMKDAKLFVLVVILSVKDNQKLTKLFSKRFQQSVYWDEYKTKIETKSTTYEYRYFLESNFAGVNILFVSSYLNRNNDVKRFQTRIYYLKKGIIKILTLASMEKACVTTLLILKKND